MKRPVSLTIVGAAWFLIGMLGAVNEAVQTHGMAIPGTHFINLFVGVGLLKGWRICRWYALFVTGLAFLGAMAFLPWTLWHTEQLVYQFPITLIVDQRPHELESLAVIGLFVFTFLIFSGWAFWILKRAEVREFFTPHSAVRI